MAYLVDFAEARARKVCVNTGNLLSHFSEAEVAREFATAGRAVLTLRSAKTGERFTYKVKVAKDRGDRFFVQLLTGPDNTGDYTYIGLLEERSGTFEFRLTAKSRLPADAKPIRAFAFFVGKVLARGEMPEALEVFHEGKCGRCGRALTVPDSILRGLGPECAKMGGD